MKIVKRLFTCVLLLIVACVCAGLWLLYGSKTSNPHNDATIGDIHTPWGYERIEGDDTAYSRYLRSLPLKERGTTVQLFTGDEARFHSLCYAVVDLPLLSNAEQCADVCMRLRAEYLFNTGQYGKIHFKNVNGKTMHYGGGSSRKAFERYLRNVYGVASTYSLSRELEQRQLKDMQPGDVFVGNPTEEELNEYSKGLVENYPNSYGHAKITYVKGPSYDKMV